MRELERSNRREVRNPVLALPAAKKLMALSPEIRAILAELFWEIVLAARANAEKSWFKNKGPMAVYWKAVGAYALHIQRVLRRPRLVEAATSPPPAEEPVQEAA